MSFPLHSMRKRINTRNECNGTRTHGNGSSPAIRKYNSQVPWRCSPWVPVGIITGIIGKRICCWVSSPGNANDHANVTFTLKQNYFPWNIDLGEKVSFEPLCCGIYVNFLFDRDFWAKQPNKYPPGYYWFSTRIRNHIFIGERITLKLNPNSSWHKFHSFFYELSTCDLYIINAIGNSYLKPKDYLSLSFGVKLQIL